MCNNNDNNDKERVNSSREIRLPEFVHARIVPMITIVVCVEITYRVTPLSFESLEPLGVHVRTIHIVTE